MSCIISYYSNYNLSRRYFFKHLLNCPPSPIPVIHLAVCFTPMWSKDCVHVRVEMEWGPHGTGPSRRWSTCEKDRARAEMEQKSKHDCAREQRRKPRESGESLTRHFAHFLKLFRRPLCHIHRCIWSPAPSTYTLHVVTMDIYLHISGYSSAQGILCACVFLVT